MDPRSVYEHRAALHLVDVRAPHEWQAGRIEGSLHIPLEEVPARLHELPAGTIVAVCRSGQRSELVAGFLRARGLDAHNLDGGLVAWERAGLPLTAPSGGPGRVV